MPEKGFFVISLDFELYWGMFDKVTLDEYGENIKGVHFAIPEILALFEQNSIHATWATVGMLMCENKNELLQNFPPTLKQPKYADMRVSAYEHVIHNPPGENVGDDPYHYGKHLVEKIIQTPHQELASHTFSHYYALDGSENGKAIFAADCTAFENVSNTFNQSITSIVFPRNQTTPEALQTIAQFGFTAYRGTPSHFLYTGKKEHKQTNLLLRALRLLDTYINLTGFHTYTTMSVNRHSCAKAQAQKNVQGSWFLRPYTKALRFLESLKIRRIKNAMTYAAKHGEIYHLWWHPHNFGINRKENMKNLLEIINHFNHLKDQYGMQSAHMNDIARRA